jgi:hypothetical protein
MPELGVAEGRRVWDMLGKSACERSESTRYTAYKFRAKDILPDEMPRYLASLPNASAYVLTKMAHLCYATTTWRFPG